MNNKIFTFLFILSIFSVAIHQTSHTQLDEESCEICMVAHIPVLLQETQTVPSIYLSFEAFKSTFIALPTSLQLTLKSRSPPIS